MEVALTGSDLSDPRRVTLHMHDAVRHWVEATVGGSIVAELLDRPARR